MKILDATEILKSKVYSDIFSKDKAEAKKQFRTYMKMYHPDVNSEPIAVRVYRRIQDLYNVNDVTHASASVEDTKIFKDKKTKKGFEITNPVIINNGTCMVYHTATKVVLEYKKEFKKFYDKYISNVKLIRYADDKMREQFESCFPRVIKHFESEDGNFIILLDKTPEVLNLGVIAASYARAGKKFPSRHAAWILNRLYNMATYMQFNDKVFNGFSLSNIWVSPEYHTALLLNGWEYSTKIGEQMIGCPKEVYNILPVKVKDSHKSLTLTDLESIKTIGRALFNDGEAKATEAFLDEGTDDVDTITDWNNYGKAIKSDFGKRQFVVWEDVPYTK